MSFDPATLPDIDHLVRIIRGIYNDNSSITIEKMDDIQQVLDHYAERNSLPSQQTRQLKSHFLAQYCSNSTHAVIQPTPQRTTFQPVQQTSNGYPIPYCQQRYLHALYS
jgi:hypothetical protein